MSNVIEQMPLYANIENAPLIKLSPLSLPIDEQPTANSNNLVNSNTIYNLSSFVNSVNANTPVGTIIAYAGNETTETLSTGGLAGYIRCNGGTINREKYEELFNVIGTTYGAGDGSTTFNLPDLQNNFLMGAGTNNIGATLHAALPNITGVGGLWHTQDGKKEAMTSGSAGLQGAIYKYAPINITRTVSELIELHEVNSIEELKNALKTHETYPILAEHVEKIIPNDVNLFVKIPQTGRDDCIKYLRTLYNVTSNEGLKLKLLLDGMSAELVEHVVSGEYGTGNYWYPPAVYAGYNPRWKDVAPAFKDVVNNYIDVGSDYVGYNSFPLAFNASLSNPIYGGSDTVQPPAVAINFYIKYKLR